MFYSLHPWRLLRPDWIKPWETWSGLTTVLLWEGSWTRDLLRWPYPVRNTLYKQPTQRFWSLWVFYICLFPNLGSKCPDHQPFPTCQVLWVGRARTRAQSPILRGGYSHSSASFQQERAYSFHPRSLSSSAVMCHPSPGSNGPYR